MKSTMLIGFLLTIKSATMPIKKTVSYHSAKVNTAKFFAPISAVMPLTIS